MSEPEAGHNWLKGCTCFRLRRTARRMTQVYDHHLAAVDLTLTQYSLLANLVRREPPSVHALAALMGMDRTTVTRTLKPLIGRGLLRLEAGADRRSRHIVVSPAGQALWDQAKPLWRAAQTEIETRLGPAETADLHRLLDQSFARLGEEHPEMLRP
ncbi:multidrug resistance operon repressor [mine drainage metagenome]|uniref:Multidrug resistance operon repressor n=1 Tax=mine drainage metagenome TaxID=410659 RepID=A0A1J5RPG9_9ZZZZ